MNYELMSAEDYDSLPEEPGLKFAEIDRICRRNMNEMINEHTEGNFDSMVHLQYMTTLVAAAAELSIPNIQFPDSEDNTYNQLSSFMLAVSGEVTRIRLRAGSRAAPYSVRLGVRTKAQIQLKIQQLRATIEEAQMPESKRKALLAKLDELMDELGQTRLSFARTMKILAAVSVGVCAGTSFLADAPQALATINRLIGADKELEEAEAERIGIGQERKLLPAPHTAEPASQANGARAGQDDLDDEIPF